jgi:hypothetical protein
VASACLVGLLVAGCSGLPIGLPSSAPATPRPVHADDDPTTGITAPQVSLQDAKGDPTDGRGRKVTKNSMIDIVVLAGSADGTDLHLTLTLGASIPKTLSSKKQAITYRFAVEANDSGTFDFWITLANQDSGKWLASIADYRSGGQTYSGAQFRGSLAVAGNTVTGTIPLWMLGSPSRVRIAAITLRSDQAAKKFVAGDHVPKRSADTPGPDWLTLGG